MKTLQGRFVYLELVDTLRQFSSLLDLDTETKWKAAFGC